MDESEWLAKQFESYRTHLQAVAYRMLGSQSEADDAVQESWLRLSRSDTSEIENLRGWLTTVVGRVCLDMLRSRKARREDLFDVDIPELVSSDDASAQPEPETILADSVGLALLVVLDTLDPAERLAFVLHDMFGVPFTEIAPIVGRSPTAARQLASRARRRVKGAATDFDADLSRQREVVDAFLAASRSGDFDALLAVLAPEIVLRADQVAAGAGAPREIRGSRAVAEQALAFSRGARFARPALVNGGVGLIVAPPGRLFVVVEFRVSNGTIAEIDVFGDPVRLRQLDLVELDDEAELDSK
jgi:RNA polymerase sigma-70 factor (ECF subfamily)